MDIQDKITFFYTIEEKLWDKKVEANKYFATLCILCVALLGAWHTAGSFLNSALDWNTEISMLNALTFIVYLWGLNIAESVFSCKDIKTATLRSLLIFASFVAGYIAGVILGVIVIIVVCIILFILGCYFVLGMLSGSLKPKGKWKTDDGDIINGEKEWGSDIVHGDDGQDYKIKDPWGM